MDTLFDEARNFTSSHINETSIEGAMSTVDGFISLSEHELENLTSSHTILPYLEGKLTNLEGNLSTTIENLAPTLDHLISQNGTTVNGTAYNETTQFYNETLTEIKGLEADASALTPLTFQGYLNSWINYLTSLDTRTYVLIGVGAIVITTAGLWLYVRCIPRIRPNMIFQTRGLGNCFYLI
jgi:hypothetical protein